MCVICDGLSRDEFLFNLDAKIARLGWTIVVVEPTPPSPGWVYTIGLTARGHPELVMVGSPVEAAAVLNRLGARIERGERFEPGDEVEFDGTWLDISDVHPAQVDQGLMNLWLEYYEAGERPVPELRALQVFFTDCLCDACELSLDTPAWVLGEAARSGRPARPNRAVRRAVGRARGRRARRPPSEGLRYRPRGA
jgi:uncharacterized protein DUF4262